MKQDVCCQCEACGKLVNLYGYTFCVRCQSKLGLHSDKTILKNSESYRIAKPTSYDEDVVNRLQTMEKDYIKKTVKLRHILERLGELT